MSFFQKDKKAKSEKNHQQVDQLLEEASKELAGDPLQEAVQKKKTTNNKQVKGRETVLCLSAQTNPRIRCQVCAPVLALPRAAKVFYHAERRKTKN